MTTIKPGDIFYNEQRGNCLRVQRIAEPRALAGGAPFQVAHCLSWRPRGECGSNLVALPVSSLTKYRRVAEIQVVLEVDQ